MTVPDAAPSQTGQQRLAPVIALSHGGGPLPVLGDPAHAAITTSLKHRVPAILGLGTASQPRAIVLVTAHWVTDEPRVSSAEKHPLLYDYYNFPPESYRLRYDAPGDPDLARLVRDAFRDVGLQAADFDPTRGWDHGVFIPLLLAAPKADIPVVQVSVLRSEDPDKYLRMGAALARLRAANIAIVGSGLASFHSLGALRALRNRSSTEHAALLAASREWNDVPTRAVTAKGREERWSGLARWRAMPHADRMHPPDGGEHFMPLLVCAGAAGDSEQAKYYVDEFSDLDIYTYYWGGNAIG